MIFIEHLQVKLSRAIMNCEKNTSNYKNRRENFQGKKTLRKKKYIVQYSQERSDFPG